ncbi:MAG: hypothetical protein Q9176_000920 [Flavoplaca citrina]
MSDLLQARIPSLFSDFTVQRDTNPDGYNANVKIWEDVLCRAARAGFIVGRDGTVHRLSLETGPYLLQKLESSEWGRPLAINAVIVGTCFRNPSSPSAPPDIFGLRMKQSHGARCYLTMPSYLLLIASTTKAGPNFHGAL